MYIIITDPAHTCKVCHLLLEWRRIATRNKQISPRPRTWCPFCVGGTLRRCCQVQACRSPRHQTTRWSFRPATRKSCGSVRTEPKIGVFVEKNTFNIEQISIFVLNKDINYFITKLLAVY